MAGRYEEELALEISQCGPAQAFDQRLALAPFTLLIDGEQMARPVKAILGPFGSRGLHDLGCHAVPTHGATLHRIGRNDLNRALERIGSTAIVQRSKPTIGAVVLAFAHPPVRPQQQGGMWRLRRIAIERTVRRQIR